MFQTSKTNKKHLHFKPKNLRPVANFRPALALNHRNLRVVLLLQTIEILELFFTSPHSKMMEKHFIYSGYVCQGM